MAKARSIRDYTDSEPVNKLTFPAEVLYTRLLLKADDYGSFHAHPALLKSFIFPLRSNSIRESDISRWLSEILAAGLIVVYEVEGKAYLRIKKYNQKLTHGHKNKFPHPPEIEEEVEKEIEEEVKDKIPREEDFLVYCEEFLTKVGKEYWRYELALRAKFHAWVDAGWKDGYGKKIITWKTKVQNVIPHLKPDLGKQNSTTDVFQEMRNQNANK